MVVVQNQYDQGAWYRVDESHQAQAQGQPQPAPPAIAPPQTHGYPQPGQYAPPNYGPPVQPPAQQPPSNYAYGAPPTSAPGYPPQPPVAPPQGPQPPQQPIAYAAPPQHSAPQQYSQPPQQPSQPAPGYPTAPPAFDAEQNQAFAAPIPATGPPVVPAEEPAPPTTTTEVPAVENNVDATNENKSDEEIVVDIEPADPRDPYTVNAVASVNSWAIELASEASSMIVPISSDIPGAAEHVDQTESLVQPTLGEPEIQTPEPIVEETATPAVEQPALATTATPLQNVQETIAPALDPVLPEPADEDVAEPTAEVAVEKVSEPPHLYVPTNEDMVSSVAAASLYTDVPFELSLPVESLAPPEPVAEPPAAAIPEASEEAHLTADPVPEPVAKTPVVETPAPETSAPKIHEPIFADPIETEVPAEPQPEPQPVEVEAKAPATEAAPVPEAVAPVPEPAPVQEAVAPVQEPALAPEPVAIPEPATVPEPTPVPEAAPVPESAAPVEVALNPVWEVDRLEWPEICDELLGENASDWKAAATALLAESGGRTIAVTGEGEGVGRTSLAITMARACASEETRVLLIDADTASPGVSSHMNLSSPCCWRETFEQDLPLDETAIHAIDDYLTIIPLATIGKRPPFEQLLKTLAKQTAAYDLIVIDAGDAGGSALQFFAADNDSFIDAAFLVRDQRNTTDLQTTSVLSRLQAAGIEHIGVIDNFVQE